MSTAKIDLIRQALSASESSIKLARQLLGELEKDGGQDRQKAKELPGVTGMFDGLNMVTDKGESYPVPENYASKSILVAGDTLKLVEQGKERRFKQIEHVKRHKATGILAKKDGKWAAVTPEGSYMLLAASVDHFSGNAGDEVLVQLPANNLQTTWAAVEKISNKESQKEAPKEKLPEKTIEPGKKIKESKGKEVKKEKEKVKADASTQDPKDEKEQVNKPATKEEVKKPEVASESKVAKEEQTKLEEKQTQPAVSAAEDELS